MLKQDVVVGKSYVNEVESVIREVAEETDAHQVRFHAFDLATGKLIPVTRQTCHRRQLARWADREASPQEIARTHPYAAADPFNPTFGPFDGGAALDRAKRALTGTPEQLLVARSK